MREIISVVCPPEPKTKRYDAAFDFERSERALLLKEAWVFSMVLYADRNYKQILVLVEL